MADKQVAEEVALAASASVQPVVAECPNSIVHVKMERIVETMQSEKTGIPVKTVKSFISKIPSVFTGSDLISWMMRHLDVDDQTEAIHLAHLISSYGYLFPIDDHILTVKNDGTYYRFQTPCFWPSKCGEPENTDYAVYLCKRTMQNKQRLELADYEAENMARLQKMFARKWDFIFMQAEAQAKVDKKRDKMERKVLDSQERAFWDVHRPAPGCVNTTEIDIKKACCVRRPFTKARSGCLLPAAWATSNSVESDIPVPSPAEILKIEIEDLRRKLDRRRIKVSKCTEMYSSYYDQYAEYDPFVTPTDPAGPWICDSADYWEAESCSRDIAPRRVRRWAFSIHEMLKDPAGREHFAKFLEKEFSAENLKFWIACHELKHMPGRDVPEMVRSIYGEFLAPGAHDPLNVDSRVADIVRRRLENPDARCFEEAEEHIFNLMKSDSYSRYIRSDMYKEYLGLTKERKNNNKKR